jgi:hypothetical protein
LEKSHGEQYNIYWYGAPHQKNGLLRLLRQLDDRRNHIVHWHGRTDIAFSGDSYAASESLVPPNFWGGSPASISTSDLNEFIQKAEFVRRSINMFHWITTRTTQPVGEGFDTARATWLQIFQQPVSFPPENTHPLSPSYKAPESPPQPSQE